jgi:thiamine-phosphate pyrophosphorylase
MMKKKEVRRPSALSVRDRLAAARLYAITMPSALGETYAQTVELACKGGADIVQLRDKGLSAPDIVSVGRELSRICREYGTLFIVNDHLQEALECGADGVHLGQTDLSIPEARRQTDEFLKNNPRPGGDAFLIGCSTHSLEQGLKAQAEGADYVGCGPVFITPTKPDTPAVGLDLVRQYREKLRIPFVAIGGVDASNLAKVLQAGARCVAVVRAVFGTDDIEESTRKLKDLLEKPAGA